MGDSSSRVHWLEVVPGLSLHICSRCQTAALRGDGPACQRATADSQWESGKLFLLFKFNTNTY